MKLRCYSVICVFLAIMASVNSIPPTRSLTELNGMFDDFILKFNKMYNSEDDKLYRFRIFSSNVHIMDSHNARNLSWTMGVNQFTDLTTEEFKRELGAFVPANWGNEGLVRRRSERVENRVRKELPASVDWRDKGAMTKVKNQGWCNSCWAFAAVEQIESYLYLHTGELEELSTQQITSCTPNTLHCGGDGGCAGGVVPSAYTYVHLFGLAKEQDYPFTSDTDGQTGTCKFNRNTTTPVVTLRGFEALPRNDLDAVMEHLAFKGPLAVAVDATPWHMYSSGILDECPYDQNIGINHAVQLVGYGSDKDGDYWILRNSVTEYFGEGGYIRMRRSSEVKCGTNKDPLLGISCVGDGVEQQTVCGACGVLFDASYPIGVRKM